MRHHPKPNALSWLLLSALVIAIDQATKAWVRHALVPYVPHEVIPHVLNWTLAFNRGAAFSFLGQASGWQAWLFSALAIVVSIGLAVWLARTPRRDHALSLPATRVDVTSPAPLHTALYRLIKAKEESY